MVGRTLLLLFLAASSLAAQAPTLVRDVNPAAYVPVEAAKAPRQFTTVAGGAVFFTPGDETDPIVRLWVTDGTAAGTRFVMPFCEIGDCAHPPQIASATLPGLAFFFAESDSDFGNYPRLWRTDGTLAGTFPITPLLSEFSQFDENFQVLGNRLLFSACATEGSSGCSLWRTDGTVAGTAPFFSPFSGGSSALLKGQAYFLGDGSAGRGLYRTDGTNRGTRLVKALPRQWYIWNLVAAGSRLFFQSGPASGQVWTSDGTAVGTRLVRSFGESDHEFIPRMTSILEPAGDGKVVLTGIRDSFVPNLWVTDGSLAGTVRLTDAPPTDERWAPQGNQIVRLGKRLVFIAGSRLWSSNGSLATTRAFGPEVIRGSSLVQTGNRVVFAAKDAAHGSELWISDGTGAGTRLLSDLCSGPCDSRPAALTAAGGLVWFRTTIDGVSRLARTDGTAAGTVVLGRLAGDEGFEIDLAASPGKVFFAGFDDRFGAQPWVSDGTRAGTRRITALPGQGGSSDPKEFTALGDRLLFTADDGTGTSFWLADGAGASPVPGTTGIPSPMDVTLAGGRAFFLSGTSELWRTDGTAPGTLRLASFPDQTLSELSDFGGRLLFLTGPSSPAFWASDGTATGTIKLFDLPAGTTKVSDVTVLGAEIYFAAETGTRPQLFRSDGTGPGTLPILDLPCSVNSNCTGPYLPLNYTRLGDHVDGGSVYFTAYTNGNGFSGPALWRTDGTAAGTVRVLPAPDRTGVLRVFFPDHLFAFNGDLYFFANVPGNATHKVLFRGRDEASAVRLSSWGSEPFLPFEPEWTPVGNTLFFRTWDREHGMELWKTDGTPEGTVLVRDVLPGRVSSDPRELTAAGGRLYFSARDADHGRELWVSDGTAAGTRLVQDLFPGGLSSDPEQLTLTGGRLFFTADDGARGREPWSLVVPVPAP